MADRPPYPGTPRWVKVQGILVLTLILVVTAMATGMMGLGGGGHGPMSHGTPEGAH